MSDAHRILELETKVRLLEEKAAMLEAKLKAQDVRIKRISEDVGAISGMAVTFKHCHRAIWKDAVKVGRCIRPDQHPSDCSPVPA